MSSKIGLRTIIEEAVAIVLVSDEEDLNGDGAGWRDMWNSPVNW